MTPISDRTWFWLFVISTIVATALVGYLFGFVIGAAVSPIAGAAAPLVVGLLAAIGLAGGALRLRSIRESLEPLASFKAIDDAKRAELLKDLSRSHEHRDLA